MKTILLVAIVGLAVGSGAAALAALAVVAVIALGSVIRSPRKRAQVVIVAVDETAQDTRTASSRGECMHQSSAMRAFPRRSRRPQWTDSR